ncbi:Glyoxylase, beta-lactamase superfamily II [Fodinibius salinus]|uniref:Glyoxylase, beta-lactamase superfamily II n=1 Tax=Fodinibius salinus TaxID=860790 RepID=A0A5D3YJX6_9BACT|nr:MBL fold metallo-hydrolase [Fodinibius salinus]TYP92032.1 Glyoxylase, beta-lactamase superfamily II [Fodinibius salinus]
MDRRKFLYNSSLLAAGAVLPFKNMWAAAPGKFNTLRRNVGYFTERGGTIGWLASDEGMAVIDSQYAKTAKHCLNGLKDRSNHPLDLLINTHHHGDHTSGNPVFKGTAEKMAAHENVPKLMKQANKESEGEGNTAYPTTTYAESWQMDLGDETIHAKYYGPGHTSGDSVIYFEKANVVHMGDLVFNRMNPYTDRAAGASMINWIKILDTVAEEYPADAMYIFGHAKPEYGVTGKKEDLKVMGNYLSAVIEHVQNGIEQGMSKKEITKQKVLDGFEDFRYADFWTLPDNLNVAFQEVKEMHNG